MAASSRKCIYCSQVFDPRRGEGDHVLPCRLFGEFEGDKRFRGVCQKCNNEFGRLEQVLMQSSHLGLFRSIVRPVLGRRRGQGGLKQRGAHGVPPPTVTVDWGGYRILVERDVDNPLDVWAVDQLVFHTKDGEEKSIRLFPSMSADRLRTDCERNGVYASNLKSAVFICDPREAKYFRELLATVFPRIRVTEEGAMEPTELQIPVDAECWFSVECRQAIAKIAFHYYLTRNRRQLIGSEPEFENIRRFIKWGEEESAVFRATNRRFESIQGASLEKCVHRPLGWHHVMAADETEGEIVVYLLFFAGRLHQPPPIHVTVGPIPQSFILHPSNGKWGHMFTYDRDVGRKYAGRVNPIQVRG